MTLTEDDWMVLDATEWCHDRIDTMPPGVTAGAELGGLLHFELQQLMRRGLTPDQGAEVYAARRRVFVECLRVPDDRVDALLTKVRR